MPASLHIRLLSAALALLAGTLAASSCRQGAAPWEMADTLWEYSLDHPEGFTLDLRTMQAPSSGIAVACCATQDSHSRGSLGWVVFHSFMHDGYVGGWLDRDSGLYYFDSTRIFPEEDMESAAAFARSNRQKAVYVISTGEEVRME